MRLGLRSLVRSRRTPGAAPILLAGVCWTLFLQTLVVPLVFPHGDAGALKFLAVCQFAAGDLRQDLALPAPEWVQRLWLQGYYPFSPPSVQRVGDVFFSHYPPLFALLSAPFYKLFGPRGLLLLPLGATWALWLSVWAAARSLRLRPAGVNATLALLVFASPVTLYGAFFWEHTLALALAFAGLAGLLLRPFGRRPSTRLAAWSGVLLGLSAFLREELLLLGALLLGLACLPRQALVAGLPRLGPARPAFVGALLALWLAFLGSNQAAYGNPLGLHARHLALETGLSQTFSASKPDLLRPQLVGATDFLEHFPTAAACLLLFLPGLGAGVTALPRVRLLLVLAAGYWLVLHWVVPTGGGKWGPRLSLAIVPLACLALGAAVDALWRRRSTGASVALLGIAGLGLAGVHRNCSVDVSRLAGVYRERGALLSAVVADPASVIVYSHHFVGHQLAGAFAHKTFFLARSSRKLPRLAVELSGRGVRHFLFLCDPSFPCGLLGEGVERRVWVDERTDLRVEFTRRGAFGRYLVYDATARPALIRRRPGP